MDDYLIEILKDNLIIESHTEEIDDNTIEISSFTIEKLKDFIENEKNKVKIQTLTSIRDGLYNNNITFETINNEINKLK